MEGKKTERNYREITQRGQSRTDRRTNGGERDRGRTRESNLLEIKSDRTEKKRGIIGVFLLLPSLLWTVISHQGTPSLWISSSLRQFHSPLSVSVTQSSLLSQSEFSSRLQPYIILYCTGLGGLVDCYLWSCVENDFPSSPSLWRLYMIKPVCLPYHWKRSNTVPAMYTRTATQSSTRWPSGSRTDVHVHSLDSNK